MQEEEKKTVDIDTTGPGAEVSIEEEKKEVEVVEPVEEKQETSDKEPVEEKVETKPEEKKELEEYSEGVKKRIAKLTKKWREAERQKEAALDYA